MMLIEGECEGLGPVKAAAKYNYTRQRYHQIRCAFLEQGAAALLSQARGPKRNYRRTGEVVRQVIRHRFLDPDATTEVIAQKLRQSGWSISTRSVERVIADYGLQKNLYKCRPRGDDEKPDFAVEARCTRTHETRRLRSAQHPAPSLLDMAEKIFAPGQEPILLLADTEHHSASCCTMSPHAQDSRSWCRWPVPSRSSDSYSPSRRTHSVVVGLVSPPRKGPTR